MCYHALKYDKGVTRERDSHIVKITKLQLSETRLFESVFPYLNGRVFHVTKESNLNAILECGEIRPNQDDSYPSTFGPYNSFFGNRGCVCLFDYRPETADHFEEHHEKCLPTQTASPESGIAIFFISESVYPILKPWTHLNEEKAYREQVLPYLEVGHPGPIALENIDEVIVVSVIEDPDPPRAGLLARALKEVEKMRANKRNYKAPLTKLLMEASMDIFRASVQYGDWKGTAAADNAEFDAFYKLLLGKGLISETDFLVGIHVYIGENRMGQVRPPYVTAFLLEGVDNYESAEAALRSMSDPLDLKRVRIENIALNDFLGLFKRFSIAISARGLDITGREILPREEEGE